MIHAGGYRRIDSVIDLLDAAADAEGRQPSACRPPSTRSTSSCSRCFDVRRAAQQVPRPGQRVRGRLVAGEKDRHRLVAHLLVGHPAAALLFVLRHEQHRQQVAAIAGRLPALGDHARR